MTGPSAKAEQALRRDVIRNDQQSKLRPGEHEPSTMFAMANLGVDTSVSSGRVGKDYVAGQDLSVNYPRLPSGPWSADYAKVPDEPPLGYPIDAQEPVGTFAEISLSVAGASADADKVEVVAPSVALPPANVEHASTTSSISSASAERDQAPKGVEQPITHSARLLHSTLTRPTRRLWWAIPSSLICARTRRRLQNSSSSS